MLPKIENVIFKLRETNDCNLRHCSLFTVHAVDSVCYKTYLGQKNWEMIPSEIKNIKSFARLKQRINCPSKLCKAYIQNLTLFKESAYFVFKGNLYEWD